MFGDGRQTRDFVYVGDVVAALIAAAEQDAGGAFNIGTGLETTVLDLVERLARAHLRAGAAGGDPPLLPRRLGGARELGWEARMGLAEGLERTR